MIGARARWLNRRRDCVAAALFLCVALRAQGQGDDLADEYSAIYYPEGAQARGTKRVLEAGMTISVESYVGEPGGPDGVKLKQQLLITPTAAEVLSTYPFEDDRLR